MNWKTEATEKLRRYDAMCAANRNIPEELSRLEADACSIRSARTDATPVKGGGNRREEALLNNIVHRQELQNRLKYTRQWLRTTNRALNALLPEEKLILSKLYIRPEMGAVEQLCSQLDMEKSNLYRKRDLALHNFTVALYGIAES